MRLSCEDSEVAHHRCDVCLGWCVVRQATCKRFLARSPRIRPRLPPELRGEDVPRCRPIRRRCRWPCPGGPAVVAARRQARCRTVEVRLPLAAMADLDARFPTRAPELAAAGTAAGD